MNGSHRRGIGFWRRIVEAQRSSGLSVAAYCRQRGVRPCSFYYWRRRWQVAVHGQAAPRAAFIELKNPIPSAAQGIEIGLRGGRRLRVRPGFDRALLLEVIHTLEGESSRLEARA